MPNLHVCKISGKPINKNHESYRGPLSREMVAAMKKDCPAFHPKDDLHKETGEKYFNEYMEKSRKPSWMKRLLGGNRGS
ncbi:MAG: hypothetical protein ACYS22_17930 [Planctomycetota bacterium]